MIFKERKEIHLLRVNLVLFLVKENFREKKMTLRCQTIVSGTAAAAAAAVEVKSMSGELLLFLPCCTSTQHFT